jgi:hypothetical protein
MIWDEQDLSSLGNPLLCEETYAPSAFGMQVVTNASICVASLDNLAKADLHAWAELGSGDGGVRSAGGDAQGSAYARLLNDMFAVRQAVRRPMADVDLIDDAQDFFYSNDKVTAASRLCL